MLLLKERESCGNTEQSPSVEGIITEGEGSAQAGQLKAVWSVFQRKMQNTSPCTFRVTPLPCLRDVLSGFLFGNRMIGK